MFPPTSVGYATGTSRLLLKTGDGGVLVGGDVSGVVFEDADFAGAPRTIDVGDENNADNAPLNLAVNRGWAPTPAVRMQ